MILITPWQLEIVLCVLKVIQAHLLETFTEATKRKFPLVFRYDLIQLAPADNSNLNFTDRSDRIQSAMARKFSSRLLGNNVG